MRADPSSWWRLFDVDAMIRDTPTARVVALEDVPLDAGWEVATARGELGITWEPLNGSWWDASAAGGDHLAGALLIVRPATLDARQALEQRPPRCASAARPARRSPSTRGTQRTAPRGPGAPRSTPTPGTACPRLGWAVMQEDRYGGWVIVATVDRLRDVRTSLASGEWRARHALNDPKRRTP